MPVYYENTRQALLIDDVKVMKGLTVTTKYVYPKEDIVLQIQPPATARAVHLLQNAGTAAEQIKGPNIYYAVNKRQTVTLKANQALRSCHINFTLIDLRELAKVYPWLSVLADKRTTNITTSSYDINPICYILRETLLQCQLIGPAANYFFFRTSIDLLHNICIQDGIPLKKRRNRKQANILQLIFWEIEATPLTRTTPSRLARRYKLPLPELKRRFLEQYGAHLNEFVHMMRMMEIYKRVVAQTQSLAAIALAAGFKDCERMSRAFKSYYGCTPQLLRTAL